MNSFIKILVFVIASLYASVSVNAQISWRPFTKLKQARMFFNCLYIGNGEILIAGGFTPTDTVNGKYTPTSGCEILNINTKSSTLINPMLVPRIEFPMLLTSDSNVVVVSGAMSDSFSSGGSNQNTTTVELFDRKSKTWRFLGNLFTGRRQHTAQFISQDEILVVGGRNSSLSAVDSCEIFNIKTGKSKLATGYPLKRCELASTISVTGEVITMTGREGSPNSPRENSVFSYVIDENRWEEVSRIYNGVRLASVLKLWDGRNIISGGFISEAPYSADNSIWIESNGSFKPLSTMSIGRGAHSMAQLDENNVVVSGTWNSDWSTTSATTDMINIKTGVTTQFNSMLTSRAAHYLISVPTSYNQGRPTSSKVFAISGANKRIVDNSGNSTGYFITPNVEILEECFTEVPYLTDRSLVLCKNEQVRVALVSCYNSIQWSNGSSLPIQTITESGTYTVNVINSDGCKGSATINVTRVPQIFEIQSVSHDTTLLSSSEMQHTLSLRLKNLTSNDQYVRVSDIRLVSPNVTSLVVNGLPKKFFSNNSDTLRITYLTPLTGVFKDSLILYCNPQCPNVVELPMPTSVHDFDNNPYQLRIQTNIPYTEAQLLNIGDAEDWKLSIYSNDGRECLIETIGKGNTSHKFSIAMLANGSYFIRLRSEKSTVSIPLLIAR